MSIKATLPKERLRYIRKFLRHFPGGFHGKKYISWERDYKWDAHLAWNESLNEIEFKKLLRAKKYAEISRTAANLESKTNLLFSFEKMALRDAIKTEEGAMHFSKGLFDLVYGKDNLETRFNAFTRTLSLLPRKQTRVLTWPQQTIFGFIGDPKTHIFLKPRVTQAAAAKYGFPFAYRSKPNWDTYKSLLDFTDTIKEDIAELGPRDMIDIQSFIWTLGSEEYPD